MDGVANGVADSDWTAGADCATIAIDGTFLVLRVGEII
jgi:hypothetical protein